MKGVRIDNSSGEGFCYRSYYKQRFYYGQLANTWKTLESKVCEQSVKIQVNKFNCFIGNTIMA